jgi:heptosyltransferase III
VSILERLPENAHVAVIRLRSLGDCVLTTPAISILNRARPDLEIGIAVEPRFAAVFEHNPAVARLLEPTIASVRRFRPYLCLNLHGGTRSMWMTAASGARIRAGFAHHKGSSSYNYPIPRAQQILGVERTVHTAEHLASAIFHLGAPRSEIPRAMLYSGPAAERRPYAVIHPLAAAPEKTWRPDGFLRVAQHLADDHRLQPIFIGGPGEDLSAYSSFRVIADAPLQQTKSLLSGASLFIGNDSGPAHMAAAFGLPVIVLFGPSDSVVWAPWRTLHESIVNPAGIQRITTGEVIAAVDRLKVRA